ncbi:MAG: hypothetical protein WD248_02985 [Actinomycetota bacterium]
MAYFIVIVLSVLVGSGVYAATLRAAREGAVAVGFEGHSMPESYGDADVPAAGPGYTYLRVGVRGPSWQDRLVGFVGLLVLLGVSSVTLAFGIYQLGHILNVTIENFFTK